MFGRSWRYEKEFTVAGKNNSFRLKKGKVICGPSGLITTASIYHLRRPVFDYAGADTYRYNSYKYFGFTLLSNHIGYLRWLIPQEFSRKPDGLHHVPRWKTTDLHLFLHYAGPVVLR